jgi:ArsR family transcriptional regulator
MESKAAVNMLSALGHEGRLAIFRLLVKAGPGGVAAGEIARALAAPPSSLSANLNVLSHAGLIASRREGRSIIYTADYAAMSGMLGFLMEDCCNGAPEICAPLGAVLTRVKACAPGSAC